MLGHRRLDLSPEFVKFSCISNNVFGDQIGGDGHPRSWRKFNCRRYRKARPIPRRTKAEKSGGVHSESAQGIFTATPLAELTNGLRHTPSECRRIGQLKDFARQE